ncbi:MULTISPECIES: site-specific integrase [unclassified Aeromicrobium]|uniref:tyrosine-type recombinase/integrase n=1 Tax=unclassified Aeromicrobium TaxID=2633570 RepID=UPI000A69CBBA|nr:MULTISPECIES: site-specific integrase [unclassified Aeromicrobium]
MSADIVRGQYFDPDAGKISFKDYAAEWLEAQTFDEGTREAVELRLRLHAYPGLGAKLLSDVKPSTIQPLLRGLSELAPTYQQVIFTNVSTAFTAAVDDSLIQKNPCNAPSACQPKPEQRKLTPWTAGQVTNVRSALPERCQLVAQLGAGLGLRQGEMFGLSPDDIDIEKGEIEIVRQVKLGASNRQLFGLPKGRKTRRVPLPDSVLDAINEHMTRYPPREVTLPWDRLDGSERTFTLLMTTRGRGALNRNYFNTYIWRPALEKAGIETERENGTHALRHLYTSTLLDAGESIKALSEYLGRADPGFTLRTYTHLMPTSGERTRNAIDTALSRPRAEFPAGNSVEAFSPHRRTSKRPLPTTDQQAQPPVCDDRSRDYESAQRDSASPMQDARPGGPAHPRPVLYSHPTGPRRPRSNPVTSELSTGRTRRELERREVGASVPLTGLFVDADRLRLLAAIV